MNNNNNPDDYEQLNHTTDSLEIGKTYFSRKWGRQSDFYETPSRFGYVYTEHKITARSRIGTYGPRVITSEGLTLYQSGVRIGRNRSTDYENIVMYRLKEPSMKPQVQLSLFDYEE